MKVCEVCGCEIFTRDGDNKCQECHDKDAKGVKKSRKARASRRLMDDAMKSLGLTKVRGAMGGTYWE